MPRPIVATKPGADMRGLHPKIEDARLIIAWEFGRLNLPLTWTSGIDGDHSTGSLHYTGRAIDIRMRHVSDVERQRIANLLRARLGWGYDVLAEPGKNHIHIEWDPK